MKKVLYIAYYWPPCGGISVVRNLKFVKYFREYGWEPIIYAPENASYPIIDHSTEKDLPHGAEIIKTPIFEPYRLFNVMKGRKKDEKVKDVFLVKDSGNSFMHKLGIWVRGNFFIPDARAFWIKPSVKYLREYVKHNKVDAIISYGPPHSMHMIALELHKEFDIPWISDWQDPWTEIDYFGKFNMSSYAKKKHERMEQKVITTADRLVMVSKSWQKELEKLSGRSVDYIPFGYDEHDFAGLQYQKGEHFIISHFGTFGTDRNPENLWLALQQLKQEFPDFDKHLRIHLAGHTDPSVFASMGEKGLSGNLYYEEHISKTELFKAQVKSNVQLVLINLPEPGIKYNNKGRIPAKLFECIGSKRPIMVVGPEDSDVANIVAETRTGYTCDYAALDKMKTHIRTWYTNWLNNTESMDTVNTEQYSFKKLTGEMARLLNTIAK